MHLPTAAGADMEAIAATFLFPVLCDIIMELECISRVLERHEEILFAYLYGSVARGEAGKESDIDIGVFLRKGFKPGVFYEVEIAAEIERECSLRDVEVAVLNRGRLRFLNQVLRHGRLIFSRDEKARVAFETYVTKAYIDFLPHFREYDRMRLRK